MISYLKFLVFALTLTSSSQSDTYGQCTTPDGEIGTCVMLNNCPEIATLTEKNPLLGTEKQFLKESECLDIQIEDEVIVCCESPTIRPGRIRDYHNTTTPKTTIPRTYPTRPTKSSATTSARTTSTTKSPTTTASTTTASTTTASTTTASTTTASTTTASTTTASTTTASTTTASRTSSSRTSSPRTSSPRTSSPRTSSPTTSLPTSSSPITLTELPEPGNCGIQKPLDRIIGGEETDIDTYRWMALLIYTHGDLQKFGCGGSLINNRYVLTAAHCAKALRRQNKIFRLRVVRLGEWNTSTISDEQNGIVADRAIDVRIENQILHPGYDNSKHDIALLRLEQYIAFTDFIQPICIHRNDDLLNVDISRVQMFASGWGVTENGTLSDVKLHIPLKGKSLAQCQAKYNHTRIVLQDTQLCAGGESGIDTCNGDSGGPLVLYDLESNPMHYHIVGIISFGPTPCGQPGFPGVYTKVNSYIDWIESNIEP